MTGHRLPTALLALIAAALAVIALNPWLTAIGLPSAEAQGSKYEVSAPKAWGKIVGFAGGGDLLFEDSEGTLRQVETYGGKGSDFPRVKVLIRRN